MMGNRLQQRGQYFFMCCRFFSPAILIFRFNEVHLINLPIPPQQFFGIKHLQLHVTNPSGDNATLAELILQMAWMADSYAMPGSGKAL
jgi:hypothetical protein